MQESASKRALLYDDLKVAITENQFEMYYQLQVNRKGKAIAAEALVRWHHPERGMVSPNEFIDFAEETNLIEDISDYAIAAAVIILAKELDLIVVAEGVETNEQRDLLLELGCDSLQGYLYSRPLPAEQVVALTEEINAKF